ncbi:hypothetical protein OIU84_001004 [Salix udensis]|uniref:Uncharacterized protein n=1 Tax=Salix udensis TaxID=889485 RepID=A0AAD6L5Y5_9ROSI|nr:hypothetical protein OIU84_001004 [Salix udensis]
MPLKPRPKTTCHSVVSIPRIVLALARLLPPSCLLLQLMGVSLMGNKVARLLSSETRLDLPENHLSHLPTSRNAMIITSPPAKSPPLAAAAIAPKKGNQG